MYLFIYSLSNHTILSESHVSIQTLKNHFCLYNLSRNAYFPNARIKSYCHWNISYTISHHFNVLSHDIPLCTHPNPNLTLLSSCRYTFQHRAMAFQFNIEIEQWLHRNHPHVVFLNPYNLSRASIDRSSNEFHFLTDYNLITATTLLNLMDRMVPFTL